MSKWKFSNASKNHLAGGHPDLIHFGYVVLAKSPYDIGIIDGVRTRMEQAENIKTGVSWTMDSMHLLRDFADLDYLAHGAFDFMVYVNGRGRWEATFYQQVYEQAILPAQDETGILITWGGNWKSKDYGHIELRRNAYRSVVAA